MHQPRVAERRGVRGDRPLAAPALTAAAWGLGLVTTAVILGTPYLVFGYHTPSLHLVLDSVDACIAFLLAYLLYGRFTRSGRLQDLLLSHGLFLLGVAGLGLSLVLSLLDSVRPGTVDVWLPVTLRVVAALLIVGAALAGDRPASRRIHSGARVAPWALLGLAFAAFWLLRDVLPTGIGQTAPTSAQRPVIDGHPLLLIAQGLTAVCFLLASLLFMGQASRRRDELLFWLGPACALGGFARVNYVLFPSLYSDWIYTGDLLRTGCYVILLVGAAREIGRYWSAQARVAVLEDRRRLARELHDGVVQELGYIRAESHGISHDEGLRERILGAVDRGLDEARAAVDALGRSPDEPLGFVVHRAAQQVAERYGARVVVELDDTVEADQNQRHALVRITREAVSNAVRHGRAECIRIRVHRDPEGRRLVVHDDGRGFAVDLASGGSGYGITSMRERAEALPGSFQIRSEPGCGTQVGVTW
jgi:signal transduction histidine kinase